MARSKDDVTVDDEKGDQEETRRKARCAAVLDALTDPEIRTMVQLIVAPAIAAATKGLANIYDLKPEAFRRPLPGIHIL